MKTIKITEETHQKLKLIQAWSNFKTLDQTINDLLETSPIYHMQKIIEAKTNDK